MSELQNNNLPEDREVSGVCKPSKVFAERDFNSSGYAFTPSQTASGCSMLSVADKKCLAEAGLEVGGPVGRE
jgi:hypothetical protein